MRYFLTGVATVAALAFCAPVGAQQANPSGGNSMGMPGPSPGGPGLTPYSTGASPPSAAAPTGRGFGPKASGGNYIPPSAPAAASDTTSAMPPTHRHARRGSHGKMARHGEGPQLTGSDANQLNHEELERLQAGNFSNPSAPPAPATGNFSNPSARSAPAAPMNRMRAGGPATSGGTRGGGR